MHLLRRPMALSMLFAALLLVLAVSAEAHILKVPRASRANKTFAGLLCKSMDDAEGHCLASTAGPCHRISDHRVRCSITISLELADKSQGNCLALMEWTIRNGSSILHPHFLGIQGCEETKPPETVPPPAP